MLINKAVLIDMLTAASDLWQKNTGLLSEIDSRFGDGDHGVAIGKIAGLTTTRTQSWDTETIGEFINGLGEGIMVIGGGSAGPLYGTMIGGLSVALDDHEEIDANLLKKMLEACLDEMTGITRAQVGDKTMMDALIPAVEAGMAASGDIIDILEAAAKAAADGAKSTEGFPSKFGRARSYGNQTIGTPDAGAISTSLLFQGLYEGFKNSQEKQ